MANAKRGKNGLTTKQQAFAVNYALNGGNGTQAALEAGYGETSAHVRAHEMLQMTSVLNEIDRQTRAYIRKLGPKAIAIIAELAVKAQSESVKQACAIDLANRSGYKLPQVIEMKDNIHGEEMDQRIMELLKQLGDSLDPAILQALQDVNMSPQDEAISKH